MSDLYTIQLAATLSPTQREIFQAEYNRRSKDYSIAMALAIVTGWWIGGHKFYLNKPIQGALHFFFSWTGVPLVFTIIDVFTMRGTIERYNNQVADEIAIAVRTHVAS